jgi:polysaccharide export outer membrane protein
VLITSNPETGNSEVLERRIEELVRSADRDAYNPVIMPGDAVACYDSKVQNARDVLKSLGDFGLALSAAKIVSGL